MTSRKAHYYSRSICTSTYRHSQRKSNPVSTSSSSGLVTLVRMDSTGNALTGLHSILNFLSVLVSDKPALMAATRLRWD